MAFLDKLKPQKERYNVNDLILAKQHLPPDVTRPIPRCLWEDLPEDQIIEAPEGEEPVEFRVRFDVVRVLAWVMAQRDDPDITLEDVGAGIGPTNMADVINDLMTYFSDSVPEEQVDDEDADTGNPPGQG